MIDILASTAVVVAAAVVVWFLVSHRTGNAAAGKAASDLVEDLEQAGLETTLPDDLLPSSSGEKIVLMEFSDFECPFCGRFARETSGRIEREFVATGEVAYVFRHFPLRSIHPHAMSASIAAECARTQGKFREMHDMLFAHQDRLDSSGLSTHAGSIGIDAVRFARCLAHDQTARRVTSDINAAARLGVKATPTFFIGRSTAGGRMKLLRRINGAAPYDTFRRALNDILRVHIAAR